VIVQSDDLLGLSTVLVAPTSRGARTATFRPEITLGGETTRILVEQLRAIDAQRLGSRAGRLSLAEMRALDDALELVLAL
jgi:mRNA interferase MazF